MRPLTVLARLCLLSVLCFQHASAQAEGLVARTTAEDLLPDLRAAGYEATLDSSGDELSILLEKKADNVVINLDFIDCTSSGCDAVEANVWYDTSKMKGVPDLKTLNSWNQEYYVQAYIDTDKNVNLLSRYLFKGGFTHANFLGWLADFEEESNEFDQIMQDLN
jgi:Putative bacterial sensory transduction regulator